MIALKSKQELGIMREASRRLSVVLDELKKSIKIGMITLDIDRHAERLIQAQNIAFFELSLRRYPVHHFFVN